MTTTNTLRAHSLCSPDVAKAARAKSRREGGVAYAAAIVARAGQPLVIAKPKPVARPELIETCSCRGHREGFTCNALGVWVCVMCDRPTPGYAEAVFAA